MWGQPAFRRLTVDAWLICGCETNTRTCSGGSFLDFLSDFRRCYRYVIDVSPPPSALRFRGPAETGWLSVPRLKAPLKLANKDVRTKVLSLLPGCQATSWGFRKLFFRAHILHNSEFTSDLLMLISQTNVPNRDPRPSVTPHGPLMGLSQIRWSNL